MPEKHLSEHRRGHLFLAGGLLAFCCVLFRLEVLLVEPWLAVGRGSPTDSR